MEKKMLVALTAVILSAAGVMEAGQIRVPLVPRQTVPQVKQPGRSGKTDRPQRNVPTEDHSNHGVTYSHSRPPAAVPMRPKYFATHYGYTHGFHFAGCESRVRGGEIYFQLNGGWFGMMGPMPGTWTLHDYLYVGMGQDGNYYLYNPQFPDVAVQLTFVQNMDDDQTDTDQDQGDEDDQ